MITKKTYKINDSEDDQTLETKKELEHDDEETARDHYHDDIHVDKSGNKDKLESNELTLKAHFVYSKRSLVFKIAATGVLLALCVAASAFDILLESLAINFQGVSLQTRIMDVIVMCISLGIVGLPFSLFIAAITPWIHLAIHPEHDPRAVGVDMIAGMIILTMMWLFYYIIFKNYIYHREPKMRNEILKKVLPGIIIVIVAALIATASFILSCYITGFSPQEEDDPKIAWSSKLPVIWPIIAVVFGIEIIRFIIIYVLFVLVERSLKPLIHHYR